MKEIKSIITNPVFENVLRTTVTPPIKGEITKGKLNWRGIKVVHQQEGLNSCYWLEQRGVRVSLSIIINKESEVVTESEMIAEPETVSETVPDLTFFERVKLLIKKIRLKTL